MKPFRITMADRLAAFARRCWASPWLLQAIALAWLLAMLALVASLSGCGHRAVAQAAQSVDHVFEGMQTVIQAEAAKTPLERDVDGLLVRLFDMSATGRALQAPVITYVDAGAGTPAVTTPEQAAHDWAGFKAAVAPVIPAARVEAEDAVWWGQAYRAAARYLGAVAGSGLSVGLLAGGGAGLLGLVPVLLRSVSKARALAETWKATAGEAVTYAHEVTTVAEGANPAAVAVVKRTAKVRARAKGVLAHIEQLQPPKAVI